MRHPRLACFCAAAALVAAAPATPASASELGELTARVLDLSPERLAAFRTTLREFGAQLTVEEAQAAGLDIELEDVYEAPFVLEPELSLPTEGGAWGPGVPVGLTGRDLVAEEQFLLEGREDDFEDAAKKWLSRRVKGSDAARSSRGSALAPKFAWDDGPVIGVRKGPLSASLAEDGWQVRWSRSFKRHPGWVARVTAGVEDGEERIAFSVGRSLLRAAER